MALLQPKTKQTKTVSFRLPASVVAEFDQVKENAAQRGLVLDLTEQVERLIATSTRQARAELEGSEVPAA